MSIKDGLAAMNLQMPQRIPHTEYSIERHWEVVRTVTGLNVNEHSSREVQSAASLALIKAWNFDFQWATQVSRDDLGGCYTEMGHAEYEQDGGDFVQIGQRLLKMSMTFYSSIPTKACRIPPLNP